MLKVIQMSKKKIFPYAKKVVTTVSLQYLDEAKDLHMSLDSYIRWLKERAKYMTAYDKVYWSWLAMENESQQGNAEQNAIINESR